MSAGISVDQALERIATGWRVGIDGGGYRVYRRQHFPAYVATLTWSWNLDRDTALALYLELVTDAVRMHRLIAMPSLLL